MTNTPEISIIIRTYNEEKYLPLLLKAIDTQSYRNFETIVVDSGSIDSTCSIAKERATKLVHIEHHDFTFGYALNIGAKVARGKYLVMVSAHTKPCNPDWLEKLIEPLRSEKVAMSYGKQIGWQTSKFSEAVDFYRIFHDKPVKLAPPHFFANNANSAVRRDLWELHKFDEHLPGLEDAEFARHWMALGYDVVYEPAAPIHHIHEETWPQVYRRYFREAIAARVMGIQGPRNVPYIWLREVLWLFGDLNRFATNPPAEVLRNRFWATLKEIVLFRYLKALGSSKGVISSETIDDEGSRDTYFFDRSAKSVILQGNQKSALQDVPVPAPKPGEVVVRVAFIGVSPGDLDVIHSHSRNTSSESATTSVALATEISGTVSAVGQNVRHLKPGDPVVVEPRQNASVEHHATNQRHTPTLSDQSKLVRHRPAGAYADYIVTPGQFVHRLRKTIDLRQAVMCCQLAASIRSVRRLDKIVSSDKHNIKCVVVGAGSLGHIAAKTLQLHGYQVHILDKSPQKLAEFTDTNLTVGTDPSCLQSCDVAVDATGNSGALETVFRLTRPNAIVLILGIPSEVPLVSIEDVVVNEKHIVGSFNYSTADFQNAVQLLGDIDLAPYCEKILPLEKYEEAWLLAKTGEYLRVIIEVATRQPQ